MREVHLFNKDIIVAREGIFDLIQRDRNNSLNIYFDGWMGFGAAAVLRSIAQVLPSMKDPPPKLRFGRIIYVDCSSWTSKRAMQKVIAQQLRLDGKTMAMFDEQDEEDDFNGVDLGSREAIRSVTVLIDKILRGSRFMMIFINGSDKEVGLGRLGIPESSDNAIILWTFSARRVTMRADKIAKKLDTDVFLWDYPAVCFESSDFIALFHEEAANIVARYPCMVGIDLTRVVDCCLYGLLLTYHSSRSTTGFSWSAHAPNFWACDGIIPGDRAWEISNALHPEISFECKDFVLHYVLKEMNKDHRIPFFLVLDSSLSDRDHKERPCRWLSVTTLRNKIAEEEVQITLAAGASSIFLAFENKDDLVQLPNGYFKHCSNLVVLVLSCCAFSFLSPPFLHCYTLKFLGLDHCKDDNTVMELGGGADCVTRWSFLKRMQIIDLYYTDWVEILSEEKIELMANLVELNIEGIRWPRWTSSHQILNKLSNNLQRLRIIMSTYDEATEAETSDTGDSFLLMDNTSLEILDLSGSNSNRVMGRNLAASISEAGRLQVLILHGCYGLGDVVLPNNSSLRSFSLDGYGPAKSHLASTVDQPPEIVSRPKQPPTDADKKNGAFKTNVVSLQGCGRLDKLFLRGLPNLVELDLSGCAIKVLDFGSMVVDVPMLKRLFLIGCERLRAIKWGSDEKQGALKLQMVCIDTRPGSARMPGCAWPPSLGAQQKPFRLQVHAIIADTRFARSLQALICIPYVFIPYYNFNIRITSTTACSNNTSGAVVEPAATASKETIIIVGLSSDQQRRHYCVAGGLLVYGDVFTKVGDGPAPMLAFPQASTKLQSDRHIEIYGVQDEADSLANNLSELMYKYTESIHMHDVSTCTGTIPACDGFFLLRWCRVERCPNLHAVFPPRTVDYKGTMETIWASDLLMARYVWGKDGVGSDYDHLRMLRHLHLHRCPSLRFGLAMSSRPSFPSLETLHIFHCSDLRHVFIPKSEKNKHKSVQFPKLTTVHLHDLPALQQICEGAEALAPALETIKIRGCWSLRRLPALKDRESGMKKPAVEVEKDVWDVLEWDGVDAGHHPSLYEAPVHSRFHKRRMLRRTVLR